MDSRSDIEFWAVTWALGLKKWLNPKDIGTTLSKIELGHWHAMLWEHSEPFG